MHVIVDNSPLVSERTPRACDFTDRLRGLNHDVLTIELTIQTACRFGDKEGGEAIVQQCRKLRAEIDELADMVLPEMTDEERAIIAAALEGRRP